ncbi:MAG TPA: hypothetical protein VMI12_13735 [Puia sp.]|nr:hypothetical protein [Puia sp.]
MMLRIDKGSSLKNIQKQFSTYYPFLKIEFFKKIPVDQPLYKSESFSTEELSKYLDGFYEGFVNIDVSRKRTVSEVERDFEKLLGISAHIFRKSGNVWVETTLTNDWPLEEQNEEGKLISSHFTNKSKN